MLLPLRSHVNYLPEGEDAQGVVSLSNGDAASTDWSGVEWSARSMCGYRGEGWPGQVQSM